MAGIDRGVRLIAAFVSRKRMLSIRMELAKDSQVTFLQVAWSNSLISAPGCNSFQWQFAASSGCRGVGTVIP